MSKYIVFTEVNRHEGERWRFYINYNADAYRALRRVCMLMRKRNISGFDSKPFAALCEEGGDFEFSLKKGA